MLPGDDTAGIRAHERAARERISNCSLNPRASRSWVGSERPVAPATTPQSGPSP
jgi:hypothetical protein